MRLAEAAAALIVAQDKQKEAEDEPGTRPY